MKILSKHEYKNNNIIYIIYMDRLNDNLKQCIDNRIVEICEGFTSTSVDLIKLKVKNFLKNKSKKQIMGSVAEFLVHLFIKEKLNLKQEFRFLNLEEDSLKKGLDGFYSESNKSWIMESKSGKISTNGICHKAKVQEAYTDLKAKVEGRSSNPWENAYSHASNLDIHPNESIRKTIRALANDYILGYYRNIEEFNIIPSGTIFLENQDYRYRNQEIFDDIISLINDNNISNSIILCITQKSIEIFLGYLYK